MYFVSQKNPQPIKYVLCFAQYNYFERVGFRVLGILRNFVQLRETQG